MNIKLTEKSVRNFLTTKVSIEELAKVVSLCGPTFDNIYKEKGECVLDIEVITNRIDTASAQGIARESAAILSQQGITAKLKNDPYLEKINTYSNHQRIFNFEFENPNLAPRFVAVSLENVSVKSSPSETKSLLTACGERPINNLVDITNELTLLYGMPCHVFDLDKLAFQKLLVRLSKDGEKIVTLDNQTNKLKGGDILIEDSAGRLVDLCGIMGGQTAEVDVFTKNILLIVPVYQPKHIRRTSLYLQKRTLASQIYEKQPDTELCLPVLKKAIELIKERAGAKVSSSVFDYYPEPKKIKKVSLNTSWLNNFIGVMIPYKQIVTILESLGFVTKKEGENKYICKVPSWRYYDINNQEDLAEEIARIYGYFKLPPLLPCLNLAPETKNNVLTTETKIRNILSGQGFNEIYNNSLISESLINKTKLNLKNHLRLTNSLSTDFEYLRTSLVPSILQNIKNNQGKSTEPFLIYEISNVYLKTNQKIPDEISNLVLSSTQDYRLAKGSLESLSNELNLPEAKFIYTETTPPYFKENNTAAIYFDKSLVGFIGSINSSVLRGMEITSNPIVVELNIASLASKRIQGYVYKPISEYPEIVECMTINSILQVSEIIKNIASASSLIKQIEYTGSYNNKHTFKVTFVSPNENLSQNQINPLKSKIQKLFN